MTDKYVHYDDKYETVKDGSVKVYRYLNDKVYNPLLENLYVIYDQSSDYYSFMLKVIKEHQSKVIEYIKQHYDNVHVAIQDNWMKLDFNNDGKVSLDDLKQGVQDLYEFLVNYDYI